MIAIINPGIKIAGGNDASIDIKNGSVLVPCDATWQGIEMIGNGGSETISIQDSYIYGAVAPLKAQQVPDISIVHNIMANGTTGIELDLCETFKIERNACGVRDRD